MGDTSIEWTEKTWNPVRGCSPISPGCKHCYAERMAGRFCKEGEPFHGFVQIGKNGNPGPRWTGKVELIPHMLDVPLRTRKPTTWFVNSMSDLFHERLSFEDIDRVVAVIALCCPPGCSTRFNREMHPEHTFQVLTKRERRMHEYFARLTHSMGSGCLPDQIMDACHEVLRTHPKDSRNLAWDLPGWPLSNLWLGVSVEDQQRADERIPLLLQTPAAVRFLSVEPLLGPVDLTKLRVGFNGFSGQLVRTWDALRGTSIVHDPVFGSGGVAPACVDWVIAGGESGPGARPCDVAWIRSIVQQCRAAGVACFVKQVGANAWQKGQRWRVHVKIDPKGGDIDEWPADLRVREMPTSGGDRA